jgi:hypothetical protein
MSSLSQHGQAIQTSKGRSLRKEVQKTCFAAMRRDVKYRSSVTRRKRIEHEPCKHVTSDVAKMNDITQNEPLLAWFVQSTLIASTGKQPSAKPPALFHPRNFLMR